jgi:demethylmenaquinone methyltransferase/2-methoxy-6-polyprenyl-1,4-benzoquinol methylase
VQRIGQQQVIVVGLRVEVLPQALPSLPAPLLVEHVVPLWCSPVIHMMASSVNYTDSQWFASGPRGVPVSNTLLDKREVRIRRMFGQVAPSYDLLNHLLSMNVDTYWRWRTTRLVPPIGDAPILDVCTGTGDLALAYDRAAGGRVPIIAADFCSEMLVQAITKTRQRHAADRIHYVEADTQQLPLPSNHFQIATVAFGLRNVTNMDRGLAEMVRVTQPGGRIAILEFSQPRHWLFGRVYRLYFTRILPTLGQAISRSKDNAYRYLPASVQEFPDGEALAARLREHGLRDVRFHPFTFGIATLYVGVKS